MYPVRLFCVSVLPYQLPHGYTSLAHHPQDELEQICLTGMATLDVGGAASQVLTGLRSSHGLVQFRASVTARHRYRVSVRIADGLQHLLCQHPQVLLYNRRGHIIYALPCCRTGGVHLLQCKVLRQSHTVSFCGSRFIASFSSSPPSLFTYSRR